VSYFIYSEVSREQGAVGTPSAQAGAVPGQTSLDIAPFERAVEENPNDPQAVLELANVLQDSRNFPRAVEMYKRYLETDPDNPNARVDLGICYFELGREDTIHGGTFFAAAIREMGIAHEKHPDHQHAAFNLGIVNLSIGNLEESSKWFRRAVETDESSNLGKRAKDLLEQHQMTE
jgi:tetratricopeptide (TPR) repeat protein